MADLIVEYTLTTPGPDIVFNDGVLGDGVDKYWIESIQGLDGPSIRAPVDLVPFGDGGIIHTFRKGPRRVIFDGHLLLDPPTLEDCQERRNTLASNLLDALASIISASGTLTWDPTGSVSGKTLTVYNEVPLQITYTDNFLASRFSFGLISRSGGPLLVAATISIGGTDVTGVAISGHSTRRLNRPSQAQVRIPSQNAIGAVGDRLKISFNGTLHHHGRILLIETEMDEDTGYTTYNSTDPMEMWAYRPVRDDDCDFSKPTTVEVYGPDGGPAIVENMLYNTVSCGDDSANDTEGPIFLDMGTFESGCCDLSGAPVDWPMTIAELTSLLMSTGCCDIVITPTDPGGGVMGTVDGYCGDYGTDLSGSVSFDYGQGNFNVRGLRWNQDMSNMCNKLWYFAGPRIQTPADPAGDQHWCFNVTGDDPLLPDPLPNGASRATLLADRLTSRTTYGVRMDIQIFDATDDDCVPGWGTFGRDLYRTRWETESWIRMAPRNLIHITPTRETEIGAFDIGDIVSVTASSAVRGGFSGAQRVYEYTISWDENGVLALSELQTSDTADA